MVKLKQGSGSYMVNLNDQETKHSQHNNKTITIKPCSLTKIPKIYVKDEPPISDILSNKMMIKCEPVDDLDCQETKSNQNVMIQLPTFINTVENEDSWPVPSSTVVIKHETDDDKRLECSDDEGDHKIDRTKIMLDNVLQNMFVAKEQRPTVTTSHPMTVELPAPIDTIVYVKNYNSFPKPLLTEEISIKIESVNDLDDKITTSRQNIIGEIPPSIDPTIPVDEDADDEETDLNKNMFVAKPPAPAAEEVSPSVEQPARAQPEAASVGHQPEKRQENTEMTPAPVSVEQKTDVTEEKKRDIRYRHPHNVQCDECGKNFRGKFYVRQHIMSVHLKVLETCGVCNKSVGVCYLKRHMKMHQKSVYCEPCSEWFSLSSYKVHMKTTTHVTPEHYRLHSGPLPREQCGVCGKMVRVDLVKVHARIHEPRERFSCAACDKTFANRSAYNHHLKYSMPHASMDLWKYKCSVCEKGYRLREELRDHENYQHKGHTRHQCPVCGKALASRRCIMRHVRRVHHGVKDTRNKICQQCGKAFRNKKGLREHEAIHTGERPLSCEVCGCTFRQSTALYMHKKRVHKIHAPRKQVQVLEEAR